MTLSIRWAVHPAETGRIEQLPGIVNFTATDVPAENSTLTHPYLVDPSTRQRCLLRVIQVMPAYPGPWDVTIVVGRQQ